MFGALLFVIGVFGVYGAIRLFIAATQGGIGDMSPEGLAVLGTVIALIGLVFGAPGFMLLWWQWRRRSPSAP